MTSLKSGALEKAAVDRILRAIGTPSRTVYPPSDDSFLMLQVLLNIEFNDLTVCDIGTGSGILGLFCAIQGAEVTVTDINEIALRETLVAAKKLKVSISSVLSDVFSGVNGKFDYVLFNPPYLPSEEISDSAVDGGQYGLSLTRKFLNGLPSRLRKNGHGLLLLSSLNNPTKVVSEYPEFSFGLLATRTVFFEELQVLGLRLS